MKVSPNLYSITLTDSKTGWGEEKQREDYDRLSEKISKFSFLNILPFDSNIIYSMPVVPETVIVNDAQIVELSIANIQFTVKQKIDIAVDITQQLIELAEKPIKLIQENSSGDTNYNTKCEVHMPNMAMTMYNEMLLLEGSCTDELQAALNGGWRIVAACPQPDQRRPDYILGRFNPNFEPGGSAERKAE